MISSLPEIRKIQPEELRLVRNLPPPEWNLDLEEVYRSHYGKEYFYAVVAVAGSEIAGTGMAVVNGNATWLGTIVVKKNYRRKGIGSAITKHLIDYSHSKSINTIILTASEMGLPVYTKIGFVHDINYLFFRTDDQNKKEYHSTSISEISSNDHNWIFDLDDAVSGEKRRKLLSGSLMKGFRYSGSDGRGFYLPCFGSGLIIADTDTAGIELLKFRLSSDRTRLGIPETNIAAIEYLKSAGFELCTASPRMFLDKNVKWDSKHIFLRGCGYLG